MTRDRDAGGGPRYCYEWPRASLTVDIAIFAFDDHGHWHILLVRRKNDPHAGSWALPGGFLDMGETTAQAALRELTEETGLHTAARPQLLGVYDAVDRDPRGRTLTIGYWSVVPTIDWKVAGRDDAAAAHWFPLPQLPAPLAFDHDRILGDAMARLAANLQVPVEQLRRYP